MQLALGDCLAIALLESKGFTARDFKTLHPGGQLGARLKFVADLMHKGERLPLASADAVMAEAIVVMTEKALGCLGVVDSDGMLKGIITDGDLRRHWDATARDATAGDVMTRQPITIRRSLLAVEALRIMEDRKITAVVVVGDGDAIEGVVQVHDLWRTQMF
jgi:arabinose-5-phosphate isomerase